MTRVLRNIDRHRKGTGVVELRTPGGRPCASLLVSAEQESHEFIFAGMMPNLSTYSESDRQRCLDRAHEVFNTLLFPGDRVFDEANTITIDLTQTKEAGNGIPLGRVRSQLDQVNAGGEKAIVLTSGQVAGMAGASEDWSKERKSSERLINFYTLCFSHPSVCGIIWQGFSDRETASGSDGLLKRDLSPKHAFQMLRKLVGTIWHSRAAGHTDDQGRFEFRGFFGDYRLVVGDPKQAIKIVDYTLSNSGELPCRIIVDMPNKEPN